MFKNRAVQIKLVADDSTPRHASPAIPKFNITKSELETVTTNVIKKTAIAVCAVIVVSAASKAGSDIVVYHATN